MLSTQVVLLHAPLTPLSIGRIVSTMKGTFIKISVIITFVRAQVILTLNPLRLPLKKFAFEHSPESATFVIVAGSVNGSLTSLLSSYPLGKLHPISAYVMTTLNIIPMTVVTNDEATSATKVPSIPLPTTSVMKLFGDTPSEHISIDANGTRMTIESTAIITLSERRQFGTISAPTPPDPAPLPVAPLAVAHPTEYRLTTETRSAGPTLLVATSHVLKFDT